MTIFLWLDKLTQSAAVIASDWQVWVIFAVFTFLTAALLAYANNLDKRRAWVLTAIIVVFEIGWNWLLRYTFGPAADTGMAWHISALTFLLGFYTILAVHLARWFVYLKTDPRGKMLRWLSKRLHRLATDIEARAENPQIAARAEQVSARADNLLGEGKS